MPFPSHPTPRPSALSLPTHSPASLIPAASLRCRATAGAARVCWGVAVAATIAAMLVVARGCGYISSIPLTYAGYYLLQIVIPGWIALYLAGVRPLTPSLLLAVGLPTGYAIEIFSFLGLSRFHAAGLMPVLPMAWMAAGLLRYHRNRDVRVQFNPQRVAGVAAVLSCLFLCTVLYAAGHLYAESPLVDGLPQRPIFHDWVYLLSRAASIKNLWPLEEPSLSGTPLQYHYFMLVHVASASATTGIDVTWIMLRLAVIPLGLVIVAQAYALGKRLGGDRWTGVATAVLLILPGELSWSADYRHLSFLGFFIRWLYVSPTFFFGLVFFGALLIAVATRVRSTARHLVWIGLLAAAGTAAKGTVVPVILLALGIWTLWQWVASRRFPVRLVLLGGIISVAFALVYGLTMAGWGTGEATVQPFHLCEDTAFWRTHAIPLARLLKRSLHAPDFGTWLSRAIIAIEVLAGTAGIRVLAFPFIMSGRSSARGGIVSWVGAALAASLLFGLTLHLDSDSELYLLFPALLPAAALSGVCCTRIVRTLTRGLRPPNPIGRCPPRRLHAQVGAAIGLLALVGCLAIQIATTIRCEADGLRDWWRADSRVAISPDLQPLFQTLRWLREHTEPDAMLVSNAFTCANVSRGRGISADQTTMGVYYYYSALAERRMWIEGPTYLLDQAEARHRLVLSSQLFYHGKPLKSEGSTPLYLVVDHSLHDGASVPRKDTIMVYGNERFEVFRFAPGATAVAAR